MGRLVTILAGLMVGGLFAVPAWASTIANFSINAAFNDAGSVSGTFSLDMATHTIHGVSITTTMGLGPMPGTTYSGLSVDSIISSSSTTLKFNDGPNVPVAGTLFSLTFNLNDTIDLSTLPVFIAIGGDETAYFVLCGGICATRVIISGSVQTLSVVATPIPASLPLLATALGIGGVAGWRRWRQAV